MRLRVLMVIAVTACASGEVHPHDEVVTLRVSTSHGVAAITPSTDSTFTQNIIELVYEPASRHVSAVARSGDHLVLKRRPDSRLSAAELAQKLKHAHLRTASADGDDVDAWLDTDGDAGLDSFSVDAGEFEQAAWSQDRLQLRRRSGQGIQKIDVVSMPTEEEEWRRFLAREVDLIPYASPSQLKYLRDVPSVKIVRIARPSSVALWFNTRHVAVEARRGISLALRRRAIAQVVTEDPTLAGEAPENLTTAASTLKDPSELKLVTLDSSADFQRAALVVQSQLAERGVTIQIAVMPQDLLLKTMQTGDYDLLIFYGGWQLRYAHMLRSVPANFSGYASPEFDDAATAADEGRASRALADDVPLTPLYTVSEGIAIDEHFCGAHPESGTDYAWLADVHPCAPGER